MANSGVAPITDFTLAVSQIRLLIGDTDASNISAGVGTYTFFADAELAGLASLYLNIGAAPASPAKRAAAQALRIIANSQVLLLKVFSSDDLVVSGDKISEAIRKNAIDLVADADAQDVLWNEDYFDYNNLPTPFPMFEGGYTPIMPYTFYQQYVPGQLYRG